MAVDLELRQAFAGLQKKVIETQAQMKICNSQISSLTLEKKKLSLTENEIKELPKETKLYESVGRMFILQPRGTVESNLTKQSSEADSKIKELEAKKIYLERSVKSSEENIREMVMQRRK